MINYISNEKIMIIHFIAGLIKKDITLQRWVNFQLMLIVKMQQNATDVDTSQFVKKRCFSKPKIGVF